MVEEGVICDIIIITYNGLDYTKKCVENKKRIENTFPNGEVAQRIVKIIKKKKKSLRNGTTENYTS